MNSTLIPDIQSQLNEWSNTRMLWLKSNGTQLIDHFDNDLAKEIHDLYIVKGMSKNWDHFDWNHYDKVKAKKKQLKLKKKWNWKTLFKKNRYS